MFVKKRYQRSHKEGGNDGTYADGTEDLLEALPRDKKQRNACRGDEQRAQAAVEHIVGAG